MAFAQGEVLRSGDVGTVKSMWIAGCGWAPTECADAELAALPLLAPAPWRAMPTSPRTRGYDRRPEAAKRKGAAVPFQSRTGKR